MPKKQAAPKPDDLTFGGGFGNPPAPHNQGYNTKANKPQGATKKAQDAIKRANESSGKYLTKELANAIKQANAYHPPPKSGGLSDQFIKEQSTASATRAANRMLDAVVNMSKPKSGSGTKSKSSGSSSKPKSSGSSTPAAPAGPSVQDLLNNMYDELLKEIGTQQTNTLGDYDKTKQGITDQYKLAQQDLYSKYQATNNPLAAQAANMGVNYNSSSINETQNAAMKRLQETGDLSLASDQSYLDKMKLMQEGAFGALKTGALGDKSNAQLEYMKYLADLAAAKKSGGGGGGSGGGRSGGSSGSSGAKGSATSTSTSIDTGINSIISDMIAKGDYEGAAYAQNAYDVAQGGALGKAATDAMFSPSKTPSKGKGGFSVKSLVKNIKRGAVISKNTKGTALANKAKKSLPSLRQLSDSGYGSPKITSTVKYTGKP